MGDKRKQRLNPELHACKENTLSLSYTPGFIFMSLNVREVRLERAQQFRALVPAEDLDLTHMAAHNHPLLQVQGI